LELKWFSQSYGWSTSKFTSFSTHFEREKQSIKRI